MSEEKHPALELVKRHVAEKEDEEKKQIREAVENIMDLFNRAVAIKAILQGVAIANIPNYITESYEHIINTAPEDKQLETLQKWAVAISYENYTFYTDMLKKHYSDNFKFFCNRPRNDKVAIV